MLLTADHVTESAIHQFSCFASDVAVFRKEFPAKVATTLGNGMDFVASTKKVQDGDLLYVRYRQLLGNIELVVYND